ncbi:MAG TPA: hypothetical protein VFH23_04280, partial [Jiangellaceae bacterium]|nr:hypothetical protein [Jiangellaceae bacterium]
MERSPTTTIPEIHPEVVAYIVHALNESEREEFRAGLQPFVDAAEAAPHDEEATERLLTDLLAYLESWRLSVSLSRNATWTEQVRESAK